MILMGMKLVNIISNCITSYYLVDLPVPEVFLDVSEVIRNVIPDVPELMLLDV